MTPVVAQGYTPDACMTDPMTPMQSIRMQAMWNAYRSSFSASGQAGAGDHTQELRKYDPAINTFVSMHFADAKITTTNTRDKTLPFMTFILEFCWFTVGSPKYRNTAIAHSSRMPRLCHATRPVCGRVLLPIVVSGRSVRRLGTTAAQACTPVLQMSTVCGLHRSPHHQHT